MKLVLPSIGALCSGALAWGVFMAVAVASAGSVSLGVAESGIYSADATFVMRIVATNALVFAAMCGLAYLISTRAGRPVIRAATAIGALVVILGVWVLSAGRAAGALGLAGDRTDLALATVIHTVPELAVMALPLCVAAAGGRVGGRLVAAGASGLVACAILEAVI